MNINYTRDDFQFNARASALIYNSDQSKVLLFNVEGRNDYLLPGGRIEELEESSNTIKREIKEELGWDNLEFNFLALSEEFVNAKGYNNQQLNIIYKAVYKEEITNNKFKGLDGDWINFEWIDVGKINDYDVYPRDIKNIILNKSSSNHLITNLINN